SVPVKEAVILKQICEQISKKDVVYIDSAGGARTTSSLIQLFTKILKYNGIKNPYSLYSDIQNGAQIYDTTSFQKMTDIADSMNEFMTTGKSDQLQKYFSDKSLKQAYSDLLKTMTEFSDKIRLGVVDSLDSSVENLRICIDKCQKVSVDSEDEIGTVIINEFLPTIEEKLLGDMQEGIDYLKIVKWCIDNGLIQQAITVFNEKIPRYIINKGYIKVSDSMRNLCVENKKEYDWEYVSFWNYLAGCRIERQENPIIDEFKAVLLDGKSTKNSEINKVVKDLKTMPYPIPLNYELNPKYKCLYKLNCKTKNAFYNSICNDPNIIAELIGLDREKRTDEKKREDNFNSKFVGIKNIENGIIPEGFSFSIKKEKIVSILYGYSYIKALRNQINHASAEENLNEEQKNILAKYGYNFDDFSLKTVKANIENAILALDIFNTLKIETEKKDVKVVEEPAIFSTDLKVGEIVSAICVGAKKVRIKGYEYDIPLVLPEWENPMDYVNQTLKAEIRQISKSQKICQVKFIEIEK
ncbi:MAG: TM1812 family CRISPR-associated protein, partial [Treponema sp.]|nr:TM1812 family CRISPR-associated protein [Treponema sp.]